MDFDDNYELVEPYVALSDTRFS